MYCMYVFIYLYLYVFIYSNNIYLFIEFIYPSTVCYFIILKTLNLYDASTCMTISDKHCFCLLQGIEYECCC